MALEEAPASGLYTRKATGLVRAAGTWSVLVYNINFVSIGLMTLFAVSLIPAFYPGSNIQLSFVLALVIVLPTSMVFAMLSAAPPFVLATSLSGEKRLSQLTPPSTDFHSPHASKIDTAYIVPLRIGSGSIAMLT